MAGKKHKKDQHEKDAGQQQDKVAETAYFIAQGRGFIPGMELDDWIQAETIVYGGEDEGRA